MGLAGFCDLIYGPQSVAGKILSLHELAEGYSFVEL